MRRNGNRIDPEQTNSLGIADADRFCISQLAFRERYAFAQDALLLFRGPLRSQLKDFF